MKKLFLLGVVISILFPEEVLGITPVHVGKLYNPDTSIYVASFTWGCDFFPGPLIAGSNSDSYSNSIFLKAFFKKNSNQFDIYSYSGKIGSTIVPFVNIDKNSITWLSFSCYLLDDDEHWETIVYIKKEDEERSFKVYDDDGTELLSGSGRAYYGVDFSNTYVIRIVDNSPDRDSDVWRFRTNISTSTPKSLSKTKAAQPPLMQIYGLSDGNYKVSLVPSSGNQVQFQMFDLMGRCVFSKQLENLKTPVTFTIPESNVPNSPFIAKVKDGNETLYKKQIPLK